MSATSASLDRSRDESDSALWREVRQGDAGAFEALFRRHIQSLADFAFSYTRDADLAEDIVQSLFVAIWNGRFELPESTGVRAYLFSAVRNRAASQARHEGAHRRFLSRVLTFGNPPESLPADRDVIAGDEAARVRRAIANLPPRCREVVVLVRLNGMTHAEAAIVLGIEPKTVEVHMGRAVKLLRAALKVG